MKHLNQTQLLEWIEAGRADNACQEHVKQCSACAEELRSLREVFQNLAANVAIPEMDAGRSEQFRREVSRNIRMLPNPHPLRVVWNYLQRGLLTNYAPMGAAVTVVVLLSLLIVFRYDWVNAPPPRPVPAAAVVSAPSQPPGDWVDPSGSVAEAVVTDKSLRAGDFLKATMDSENGNNSNVAGEFSGDPFHNLTDLKPDEMTKLKSLLKEQLKG